MTTDIITAHEQIIEMVVAMENLMFHYRTGNEDFIKAVDEISSNLGIIDSILSKDFEYQRTLEREHIR